MGWHERKGMHRFYAERLLDDAIWVFVVAVLHNQGTSLLISYNVRAVADEVTYEHHIESSHLGEIEDADFSAIKSRFEVESSARTNLAIAHVRAALAIDIDQFLST